MYLDDFKEAVSQAEAHLRMADMMANEMAKLLVGRLRHVDGYNVLKNLKAELKDYNAHTGQWKEQK